MNSVNFNIVTPNVNYARLSDESTDKPTEQVNFKGKSLTKNNPIEIIDRFNDTAVDLLNKKRPVAEKKETAIRKSLERIFKKLGFGKKLRNAGEEVKQNNNNNNTQNLSLEDGIDLMKQSFKDINDYFKKNNIV